MDKLIKTKGERLTVAELAKIVAGCGEFFSVEFIKRSDGKMRRFRCRQGVKKHLKGGSRAYDFEEKNLLGVWIIPEDRRQDGVDQGYRTIPAERVLVVRAHGKVWCNVNGHLVEQKT